MRVVWLALLLLAILSLVAAEDQPSCGVFPTSLASDCSVSPRVARAVTDRSDTTSERPTKHKRRNKSHKHRRVSRSPQAFEAAQEDYFPQERYPNPRYEEQVSFTDWRNWMRPVQSPAFLSSPRYCPHCRQLLPPETPLLHHPIDPRMFLSLQSPRLQVIPVTSGQSYFYEPQEEYSNYNGNTPRPYLGEEMCPFSYQMEDEGDETFSRDYYNQTTPNSNKTKEFKKTPPGLSDVYMDPPSDGSLPQPTMSKSELASFLKKAQLPTVEELAKYMEKKNSDS